MKGQQSFNFQSAIEQLRETFQLDFVGLALVDISKKRHELKWRYVSGNLSTRYRRIVLQSGRGVAGLVFKMGKPIMIENVEAQLDPQDLYNHPIVLFEKLKSFGAMPLFQGDHVQGVLLIGYRKSNKMTEETFEQFKQAIGTQFGPFYLKERMKDDVIEQ
ncbi:MULTISPECIES: GAF domain-containing protein [Sporosarcina]|uniref:Nitrogen regulatory protein A n=1 Tax=Sporosarcina newyorkensis TaxID=759851 RepID=A0A1T4Y794_9BACL|nr:GAF domain-containing protein [Sporosarcina newyorkensis]SKA97667.1 nitrogen regulatory protein A [Sporosarcina newyorkensis]